MKIGIFEVDHYELAYSICRLFDWHENNIYFFVNRRMYEQLNKGLGKTSERFKWLIIEDNEPLKDFLDRTRVIIIQEDIDLFFLNSVYSSYNKYASFIKKAKTRTVLTLHNINSWLKPNTTGIESYIEKLMKKKMLNNVSGINVLGDELRNYFLSVSDLKKPVLTLPYCIYEIRQVEETLDNTLKLVIPGSIDSRRRDYFNVLAAFEKIFEEFSDLSLYILGKPIGKFGSEVLEICRKLKAEGKNIKFCEDFVPQDEFERVMSSCDAIISPVNKYMFIGKDREEYGVSKATGATFDMIRYAKPGIVPSEFNVPSDLKGSIIQYKDQDELYTIIKMIHDDKDYRISLREKALSNSQKYSLNSVRDKIQPQIDEIMKNERW
jgi:glycosyltransferase involved in cell wall biosynthesis